MLGKIYRWHMGTIRDHIYNEKMASYDVKKRQSGGTDVVVGHGPAIAGYYFGKILGHGLRQSNQLGWRERLLRLYGPGSYLLILVALLVVSSFGMAVLELAAGIELNPALILSTLVLAGVPNLHGRYLAKQDAAVTKRLERLSSNPSAEAIDLALENVGHRQGRANESALRAAARIVEESPGKAIKYSSAEPDAIYEILVEQVTSANTELTELSLRSLVWISRDYGQLPRRHAALFREFVQGERSPVQIYATLILGNMELTDGQQLEACARALKPAVEDPDGEVRAAAATALGNVPCEAAVKLLRQLTTDSDPTVRQTAAESLRELS